MDEFDGVITLHKSRMYPTGRVEVAATIDTHPCLIKFGVRPVYLDMLGDRIEGICAGENSWFFKTCTSLLGLKEKLPTTIHMFTSDDNLFIGMYRSERDLDGYYYQGLFHIEPRVQ